MPDLSVIVPTFNEHANIPVLVDRLSDVLQGIAWELVVVDDDSPDGTADVTRDLAQSDPRVRILHRVGRRGLSTAVVEGVMATSSPIVAVMDGDLQHDERLLPKMLATLDDPGLDLVVGSRHVEGGGLGDWDAGRARISRVATALGSRVVGADLKDPMSGFFMVRRSAFQAAVPRLSGFGFKILLDLLASSPKPLRFVELPFVFRTRTRGESKLDSQAIWSYLQLLADKSIGRLIPLRFIMFCLVGGMGVAVHLAVLHGLLHLASMEFLVAQMGATLAAMTSNFLLNNQLTFRDRRLTGLSFVWGLISFWAVCSVGAVANVGVATVLFYDDPIWWLAGLAGAVIGAVWNFAVSSIVTWRST